MFLSSKIYQKYHYEHGNTEHFPWAWHCVKHFAFVISLNSHNSSAAGILTLILHGRTGGTEVSHLPKVTQPEPCAGVWSPRPALHALHCCARLPLWPPPVVLVSHTSQFLLLLGYEGLSAFFRISYSFPNGGHPRQHRVGTQLARWWTKNYPQNLGKMLDENASKSTYTHAPKLPLR